jgi:hypothetical protein
MDRVDLDGLAAVLEGWADICAWILEEVEELELEEERRARDGGVRKCVMSKQANVRRRPWGEDRELVEGGWC